jgi:K+-transporting ATPase ATPase A chain
MNALLQDGLLFCLLLGMSLPLGLYIRKIMNGERVLLGRFLSPVERLVYRFAGIQPHSEMSWRKYLRSILVFSFCGWVLLFCILLLQGLLPGNPQHFPGLNFALAFNTASSFVTNTNWQAYSGETTMSNFSQMVGLTVQNFISAAVGIAVLFALIRALVRQQQKTIGNFWSDLIRIQLYILLPISFILAILLVSQGVIQSFAPGQTITMFDSSSLNSQGSVMQQFIPSGPAASQVAIKQLGSNGGGFFGVNSAHPFENPTPFSSFLQMLAMLLIPTSLFFTLGSAIKDKRQGIALLVTVSIIFLSALFSVTVYEQKGVPSINQSGSTQVVSIANDDLAQISGNLEGKELRFGSVGTAAWSVITTAVANGSINGQLDSMTPIGGMIPMVLIQLGEVVFGGVGCGLYGLLAFVILTVFMAGLMVGRTPEYLGKKIEPYEMKMATIACLATPIAALLGTAFASVMPDMPALLTNTGPHGFSELLYGVSSAAGNNGSAFAGLNANVAWMNILFGLIMLLVRFVPMGAILAMSGSLAIKKKVAVSAGTLPTHNALFIILLIAVILIIGALSFFPALALGPIAEHLQIHLLQGG